MTKELKYVCVTHTIVFRHRTLTLGGTFWPFHRGHKTLLDKAFADGLEIFVGMTSDRMVSTRKSCSEDIPSYGARKENLNKYLEEMGYADRAHIFRIEDEYGFAADFANLQAIAVTKDTEENARRINERRLARGMKPLELILVEIIAAEDGSPISSARIRRGEIDMEGKLIKTG